jgi:hypothetical protein
LKSTVSGPLGTEAAAEVLVVAGNGRAAFPTGASFAREGLAYATFLIRDLAYGGTSFEIDDY